MGLKFRGRKSQIRAQVLLWNQRAIDERNRRVELGRQLSHAREQVAQLEGQIEDQRRENAVLERLLARITEQNGIMMGRIDSLVREVVQIASRPPQVVDQTGTIKQIGDVLANILIGRDDGASGALPGTPEPPPGMGDLGLAADFSVPGTFPIPSVELDPLMEDSRTWQTIGEWNAHTPTIPSDSMVPTHVLDSQGRVMRADGMPMFQAGSTAPPPAGGVE